MHNTATPSSPTRLALLTAARTWLPLAISLITLGVALHANASMHAVAIPQRAQIATLPRTTHVRVLARLDAAPYHGTLTQCEALYDRAHGHWTSADCHYRGGLASGVIIFDLQPARTDAATLQAFTDFGAPTGAGCSGCAYLIYDSRVGHVLGARALPIALAHALATYVRLNPGLHDE
jgi:hypothetical protein